MIITVYFERADNDVDTVVQSYQRLLLNRGVSNEKGIVHFKPGQSHVLVTNFCKEYQSINNGAAFAFLREAEEARDVIAVTDFERAPDGTF